MRRKRLLSKIRGLILFFIIVLLVSGITVFPLEAELAWLSDHASMMPTGLGQWVQKCYIAFKETNVQYPMVGYGYDWLAFAHIIIALAYIGPFRDPVKNSWLIDWGLISCMAVVPLAFIAGTIRQVPLFHILIDCSFGIIGIIPLWLCRKWIKKLGQIS
ncbi:hypothetical protein BH11BAC3_BH11BAC3_37480 [soil metagenome]